MLTDEQLIAAYRGGDLAARDILVKRYYGAVCSIAKEYVEDNRVYTVSVDEMMSHGLVGMLKIIDAFQFGKHIFRRYLKMRLYGLFRDVLRSHSYRTSRENDPKATFIKRLDRITAKVKEQAADKPWNFDTRLFAEEVWTKINALPDWDRDLMYLHFRDGNSTTEIAKKLGYSRNYITVEIASITKSLAAVMDGLPPTRAAKVQRNGTRSAKQAA